MNPETEELACLYVLDQLGEAERASVEARLEHDDALASAVRTAELALARQVASLPRHEPSPELAARIEDEIDRLSPSGRSHSLLGAIARWGIAAAIAASVGTLAYMNLRPKQVAPLPHLVFVGLDSANSTLAELPASQEPKDADASFIQLASLAERYWKRPEDLPVKLATGSGGSGYALFDEASNQGYIAIRRLPVPEEGKRYHLWLVDTATGQVREAGVLPAADSNKGLYFFSVSPETPIRSGRLDFFVTAEDGAQAQDAQPRGKVVLGDRRI
ncbi:MAG TPA: anti-sigma factor [Opitutaceae bacterium]|nr:anti-sigma factor [Opitutaceae bacterium]